jgi:hypothetical protein
MEVFIDISMDIYIVAVWEDKVSSVEDNLPISDSSATE